MAYPRISYIDKSPHVLGNRDKVYSYHTQHIVDKNIAYRELYRRHSHMYFPSREKHFVVGIVQGAFPVGHSVDNPAWCD